MPAKSFLGDVRDALRHFYAADLHHEVSDANIRGYLRAATQIEDVWQQIDDGVARLLDEGEPPWTAYGRFGYALAFIRIARTHQIFVRELIAADAAFHRDTSGYLPRVTYDQADALCHQIQPNLQRAVKALHEPAYQPDVALPLSLGPRIEVESGSCPLAHLQGMVSAASEVREWAAGLTAQYCNAVAHAQTPAPAYIAEHVAALQSRLAQADFALRFGTDLVGQIGEGQATPELHEQAEDNLWEALRGFYVINQAVALPELLRSTSSNTKERRLPRHDPAYHDKRVHPHDLWRFAAPSARVELRGTAFGQTEMSELCQKIGGVLSAGAQQYLDETEAAVARGDAYIIAAMANCPFEPLYRARRQLEIAGATVPAGHEFHWDFHHGHVEQAQRFSRVRDWQECKQ